MLQRYGAISVILASLLFPASSFSAETKLVRAVSRHFELYTTNNDAAAKDALIHFETVRGYLLKAFHTEDPFAGPVRIVAFKSEGEFGPYIPRNVDPAADAFFTGNAEHATLVMASLKNLASQHGTREYIFGLLNRLFPNMPYWLKTGLSEFYGTLEMDNGSLSVGLQPIREFHSTISRDFDMGVMFELKGGIDRNKGANDFYAQPGVDAIGRATKGGSAMAALDATTEVDYPAIIWQLIHMLMFQKTYSPKYGAFVGALAGGGNTTAVVQQVLGQSLVGLRQDLLLYAEMPSHAVAHLKFQLDEPVTPQVSQLSPAESALVLADLKAAKQE